MTPTSPDPDPVAYVTYVADPDIVRYDVGDVITGGMGPHLTAIKPDGSHEVLWTSGFSNPTDIAFDSSGRMLFIDPTAGGVFWTTGSEPQRLFSTSDKVGIIVVGENDNIYIAEGQDVSGGAEVWIYGYCPNGTPFGDPVLHIPFSARYGLPFAFGPGGSWGTALYFIADRKLWRADLPADPVIIGTGFAFDVLGDMVFDDEAMYISSCWENRILRITPAATDTEGPVTTNVIAEPTPINTNAIVTATVDDSATGGSNIQLAEYCIDSRYSVPDDEFCTNGSGPYTMSASDGAFDEIAEDVYGVISAFSTPGIHEVCVRGWDTVPNDGPPACTLLAIYDPDGGFVTGGGWIWSLVDDDYEYMAVEGKANFGFVSKYKKGATVPTGQTEFVFKMADLNFHSSSYEWLVVTGSDYAKFKGTGTINGEGDYKFMIWAGDSDLDTFRIRIWKENDEGIETAVYDNGMDQAIGGGSIKVHTK